MILTDTEAKVWAEHIIKKFGVEEALQFSNSDSTNNCPCVFLQKECPYCNFKTIEYETKEDKLNVYLHCKPAIEFYKLITPEINLIKNLIYKKVG